MLFISLVLSTVLLLIVHVELYGSKRPFRGPLAWSLIAGIGLLAMCGFPALFIQVVGIVVAILVCQSLARQPGFILLSAYTITVIVYGIVGYSSFRHLTELRERFPYESLEVRLPVPKRAAGNVHLASTLDSALQRLEEKIDMNRHGFYTSVRAEQLRKLHEDTVGKFISSRGFGVGRMSGISESWLNRRLPDYPPVSQPGDRSPLALSGGEGEMKKPSHDTGGLLLLHEDNLVDFANAEGFGYFKDRGHVAGFQSHRFSRAPEPSTGWRVQTLNLVGLVLHDEPVAYVSAHLPRMDELGEAPTRPLDVFEGAGLKALEQGEDVFVRETDKGMRMLGAVRAAKQCVKCHGGERGDLLGAFSYTLEHADRRRNE
jgi:hypothetical protein